MGYFPTMPYSVTYGAQKCVHCTQTLCLGTGFLRQGYTRLNTFFEDVIILCLQFYQTFHILSVGICFFAKTLWETRDCHCVLSFVRTILMKSGCKCKCVSVHAWQWWVLLHCCFAPTPEMINAPLMRLFVISLLIDSLHTTTSTTLLLLYCNSCH